ncbi:Hint domain protein [Rubellimicrobium thermophilum DSM 16684]|uniref:Hint domain protein n=1 Tax=Rubellimicrobium thermophilum DSM 16684 TaxID=1123069 RepID=S9R3G9_9RHOB|nr:Hint domain-containing protein [Rubellimicrobium thermophilum]EPX86462.1 Hint domain protein [Rubellimicrobium thermophilum DSM 16684]
MAELSLWARGVSGKGKKHEIDIEPTGRTPVTQLTFVAWGPSGDLQLDMPKDGVDPNTRVVIDGRTYDFRVDLFGTLPQDRKFADIAGEDLRDRAVAVIEAGGRRYVFLTDGHTDAAVMQALPSGRTRIRPAHGHEPILICFLEGTRIATPAGPVPVEDLAVGDPVTTWDGRAKPLRWIGRRLVTAEEVARHPELRPVVIPRDLFGPGRPCRDLAVSPQHRIVVEGWRTELLFGWPQVLAPACHFLGHGARRAEGDGPFRYYHLLFDDHEIVLSESLPTESFQPGIRGLEAIGTEARNELFRLFPALQRDGTWRRDALPSLRRHQTQLLLLASTRLAA